MKGPKNPHWKGGRQMLAHGYRMVLLPDHPSAMKNGYVLEHRLVASELLGRALLPGEVVHHINGERADNRPENLIVLTSHDHKAHHAPRGPANPKWISRLPKLCATCGTPFIPQHRSNYTRARFCSRICCHASGPQHPRRKVTAMKLCATCGTSFIARPRGASKRGRFCSRTCYYARAPQHPQRRKAT